MTWSSAYLFKIVVLARHPQAPLVVNGTSVRTSLGSTEELFELHHPRIGEEERGIPRGDK